MRKNKTLCWLARGCRYFRNKFPSRILTSEKKILLGKNQKKLHVRIEKINKIKATSNQRPKKNSMITNRAMIVYRLFDEFYFEQKKSRA